MNPWRRQIIIAIIALTIEFLLFISCLLYLNRFHVVTFSLTVAWAIWLIFIISKYRNVENKLKNDSDEKRLDSIDISVIEKYLRKKKLDKINKQ